METTQPTIARPPIQRKPPETGNLPPPKIRHPPCQPRNPIPTLTPNPSPAPGPPANPKRAGNKNPRRMSTHSRNPIPGTRPAAPGALICAPSPKTNGPNTANS